MEENKALKIEQACLDEINEVLKKHSCSLSVAFKASVVLGQEVLVYQPIVVYKREKE